MSEGQRCPLCNKWLPDLNAMRQHMFSPRHNMGQDVLDALRLLTEIDEEYCIAGRGDGERVESLLPAGVEQLAGQRGEQEGHSGA